MRTLSVSRLGSIVGAIAIVFTLSLAFGAAGASAFSAVDSYGHSALPSNLGWSQLTSKAHKLTPKLKIFGIHPQKSKGNRDFFDGLALDGAEFDDWGQGEANYGCDNDIKDYNLSYHTPAYQKWTGSVDFKNAPPTYDVLIENSTPRTCDFFFGRQSSVSEYTRDVFTPVGSDTISYTTPQKVHGKIHPKKHTTKATVYKDTSAVPDLQNPDCIYVATISGTTVSILINHNGPTNNYVDNCAETQKFANSLSQMTYRKN